MANDAQKDKQKTTVISKKSSSTARKAEPRARLEVKIGGGEVRFEAGLGAVERRFDGVMERLFAAWQPADKVPGKASHPTVGMRLAPQPPRPLARSEANYPELSIDPSEAAECFSVNAANELALRVMPRGFKQRDRDADALLLLLYGMLALQDQSPVTAPALMRSARQSGLKIDRASRLLDRRRKYLFTEGRRRGKRYGLTTAGVQYCEDLLGRLHTGPKTR